MKQFEIINGDSLKELDKLPEKSIDAVITDPPYGLTSITKRCGKEGSAPIQHGKDGSFQRLTKGFMGKQWDGSGIEYNVDLWRKVYRVMKPGAYLLAFGGARTFHRIACAIEDAGFEIKDTIMWLYGSGFPKSMSIGKCIESKLLNGSGNVKDIKKLDGKKTKYKSIGKLEVEQGYREKEYIRTKTDVDFKTEEGKKWDGWGTQLKPAYEPIIMTRKPVEKTIIENVMKYGVGGINIDECRVGVKGGVKKVDIKPHSGSKNCGFGCNGELVDTGKGRYPANLLTDGSKEVAGGMPETKSAGGKSTMPSFKETGEKQKELGNGGRLTFGQVHNVERLKYDKESPKDEGNAIRYFKELKYTNKDRFPSNVITDGSKEVKEHMPNTKSHFSEANNEPSNSKGVVKFTNNKKSGVHFEDEGSAGRYFKECDFSKKDKEGRYPANIITDESDEVKEGMPESKGGQGKGFSKDKYKEKDEYLFNRGDFKPFNDEGSACRYFYGAKASSKDRDDGLDLFDKKKCSSALNKNNGAGERLDGRETPERRNIHPCVKPVELMQYLIRLVCPKGATILDPFNGSGSTGKAVAFENRERNANYKYIGIELDPEYCHISLARIDYALNKYEYDEKKERQEMKEKIGYEQLSLFDEDK